MPANQFEPVESRAPLLAPGGARKGKGRPGTRVGSFTPGCEPMTDSSDQPCDRLYDEQRRRKDAPSRLVLDSGDNLREWQKRADSEQRRGPQKRPPAQA